MIKLVLLVSLWSATGSVQASYNFDWITFKDRFLMEDGRIVDTGNGSVSHSEGQGYGMLFSIAANDKTSFEKMWKWTKTTLQNPQTKLFYWRYNPVAPDPLEDKNNATDGDVLIAWALLKAGKKWDTKYLKESDQIIQAVMRLTVIKFSGKTVILPGVNGFHFSSYIYLNPSYFIFPAWRELLNRNNSVELSQLINDSRFLLKNKSWVLPNLSTDWVTLYINGDVKPADKWPARVSYDAIRIPLYIKWDQKNSELLKPWVDWFSRYSRMNTPAWIDISNNQQAEYMMTGGLLSVRDLTMNTFSIEQARINDNDDYYSACLKLLSVLAFKGF